MRIGFAKDIHRLMEGRNLILGGVNIPYEKGELAHSDGDVVFHALAESILGALALGDLGTHFPDNDPKYKNIKSSFFLEEVNKMMKKEKYTISNIDISIVLERPKLKDYILKMRENIADIFGIDICKISIKACTNEGIGELGNNEAVEASSIVLLEQLG